MNLHCRIFHVISPDWDVLDGFRTLGFVLGKSNNSLGVALDGFGFDPVLDLGNSQGLMLEGSWTLGFELDPRARPIKQSCYRARCLQDTWVRARSDERPC